jgi:hypothetical protein
MQHEGCRIGPIFYIRHPTSSIQAVFFSSLPVKLRLKPSSEERGWWFEAQLHWE